MLKTTIFFIVDLIILNSLVLLIPLTFNNNYLFLIYISVFWTILSFKNNFYDVYSFTRITKIISLLIVQFSIFCILLYAFLGIFNQPAIGRLELWEYFLIALITISSFKIIFFYLFIKYRKNTGRKLKKIIIIGENYKTKQLSELFSKNNQFGYKLKKLFNIRETSFNWDQCFNFILQNNIDEIFCSISELSNEQLKAVEDFADSNIKVLKFLPDNQDIFTKKLIFNYYGYTPILSLREIPLDDPINKIVKRGFDILFSLLIIVFVLSWLIPILGILIKLESKGPIFFKQDRPGLNEKSFFCYKFRSMHINESTEKSATKNDPRITKIGEFMRKTSIDELPQFYNVLFGDMSVVGPRPHLWRQNEEYATTVNKYMVRYFVKPGITGLAQTKGFRGEIETDIDIINRIKYDIFYIENWSLLLDFKIIVQTIINIFKGEDKAY